MNNTQVHYLFNIPTLTLKMLRHTLPLYKCYKLSSPIETWTAEIEKWYDSRENVPRTKYIGREAINGLHKLSISQISLYRLKPLLYSLLYSLIFYTYQSIDIYGQSVCATLIRLFQCVSETKVQVKMNRVELLL